MVAGRCRIHSGSGSRRIGSSTEPTTRRTAPWSVSRLRPASSVSCVRPKVNLCRCGFIFRQSMLGKGYRRTAIQLRRSSHVPRLPLARSCHSRPVHRSVPGIQPHLRCIRRDCRPRFGYLGRRFHLYRHVERAHRSDGRARKASAGFHDRAAGRCHGRPPF